MIVSKVTEFIFPRFTSIRRTRKLFCYSDQRLRSSASSPSVHRPSLFLSPCASRKPSRGKYILIENKKKILCNNFDFFLRIRLMDNVAEEAFELKGGRERDYVIVTSSPAITTRIRQAGRCPCGLFL